MTDFPMPANPALSKFIKDRNLKIVACDYVVAYTNLYDSFPEYFTESEWVKFDARKYVFNDGKNDMTYIDDYFSVVPLAEQDGAIGVYGAGK